MFRRKRSTSNPPRPASSYHPTPSAVTAAAQSFLKQQEDDVRLSNAAAAAALRSLTTTPTPVGDIQTKRMIRRGSNSSNTSSLAPQRPPFGGLQRSPSSGSLSERTFRTQSPGGSRASSPVRKGDVPPVPRLPAGIAANSKSHRRSASLQTERSAMTSPPPHPGNQKRPNPPPVRTNVARPASTIDPQSPSQADGPRSINFSRPMSPNASPTVQRAPRPASSLGFSTDAPYQLPIATQIAMQRQAAALGKTGSALTAAQSAARIPSTSPPPARRAQPQRPMSALATSRPPSQPAQGPPGMVWVSMDEAIRRGLVPNSGQKQNLPARPASALATTRPQSPPSTRNPLPAAPLRPKETPSMAATNTSAPVQRPASMAANRQPSDDQIRVFQTRAAALLARPLTDASAASQPPKPAQIAPPKTQPASAASAITKGTAPAQFQSKSPSTSKLSPAAALQSKRTPSMSPSRSAHFSRTPTVGGIKHEPPPRAASPYKSALKTGSHRPESPAATFSQAPTSDTSSIRSEDGSVSSKKKKSVRVSFDATPLTVGEAAPNVSPINNIMSPQHKKDSAWPVDEAETGMAPRPTLPSFGSVRGHKIKGEENVPSSPTGSTVSNASLVRETLADIQLPEPGPTAAAVPSTPIIAVQPATPATEEPEIPAAPSTPPLQPVEPIQPSQTSPDLEDVLSAEGVENVIHSSPTNSPRSSPPRNSQSEFVRHRTTQKVPELAAVESASSILQETVASEKSEGLGITQEATSPDLFDAVESPMDDFADAAEDPSEFEDGAYASLDAIIEDPVDEVAEPVHQEPVPEAPHAIGTEPGIAVTTPDEVPNKDDDWEKIRSYWNSLTMQQRQQLEAEALPLPEDDGQVDDNPSNSLNKKISAGEMPFPPWPDRNYRDSVVSKSGTQGNVEDVFSQPPPKSPARLAKAQMGDAPSTALPSVQSGESHPSTTKLKGTLKKKTTAKDKPNGSAASDSGPSAEAIALAKALSASNVLKKPSLLRSDSSDSDSSFKRRRRSSATDEGRYTMKRSMRGAANEKQHAIVPQAPASHANKRHSMRMSVRDNADDRRASKDSGKFLGIGKSKSKKPAGERRYTSRIVDSSDEDDDDGPSRFGLSSFRSKFADSDDEDEDHPKLTPVRRLPRKAGQEEGDSTDLSDEEHEGPAASSKEKATASNGIAGQGKAFDVGTLRPTHKRDRSKSSIFSLGKKKPPVEPSSPEGTRGRKGGREDASATPRESSRGSSIFRRRFGGSHSGTPKSENGPGGSNGQEFPIPPIPDKYLQQLNAQPSSVSPQANRPGTAGADRSALNSSASNAQSAFGSRPGTSDSKQKKFSGLRKLFRLHD